MRTTTLFVLIASFAVLTACAPSKPQSFETPEAAVQALIDAAQTGETKPVLKVLGEGAEPLIDSGDPVADKNGTRGICRALQGSEFARQDRRGRDHAGSRRGQMAVSLPSSKAAKAGISTARPAPKKSSTAASGKTSSTTIQSCLAYVDAQREYYQRNPQNDPMLHYASRLISTEGKKDGLYWPPVKTKNRARSVKGSRGRARKVTSRRANL